MLYGFLLGLISLLSVAGIYFWVEFSTKNQTFSEVKNIPANEVGLVLGTSKRVSNGNLNLYFKYRMEAAAELYHRGKIKHILVSGDNRRSSYNEPVDMQQMLMDLGVPKSAITLDYAGFRTLDSVVRSREVFQQNKLTIISQKFHNERALFIARNYGIEAIAFNAKTVSARYDKYMPIRETLARVKAFIDLFIINKKPKFLGDPIPISAS